MSISSVTSGAGVGDGGSFSVSFAIRKHGSTIPRSELLTKGHAGDVIGFLAFGSSKRFLVAAPPVTFIVHKAPEGCHYGKRFREISKKRKQWGFDVDMIRKMPVHTSVITFVRRVSSNDCSGMKERKNDRGRYSALW